MPSIASGPAERVGEELQAQRARYRISCLVVAHGDMDAFVPVVDRLAGTLTEFLPALSRTAPAAPGGPHYSALCTSG